jgi:hypothetical protein
MPPATSDKNVLRVNMHSSQKLIDVSDRQYAFPSPAIFLGETTEGD